jgi:hypothetical protein
MIRRGAGGSHHLAWLIALCSEILESGFEYNFSVGFSYTFGSIFSNVVNPRLGGSTGSFVREL